MKFESAERVPSGTVLTTDVCVIGSGAAGITLAKELDGSGLEVLVLEAGGMAPHPATERECFDIETLGVPQRNPIPSRGRWFGGSTNLWFGRIAYPDPIDFEVRPWVPHSGWPLRRRELQSWLERAAHILDVPHFDRIHIESWPANPVIRTFMDEGQARLGVFLWADGMFMGKRHRAALAASRNVRVLLEATATELVPSEDGRGIESLVVRGPGGVAFEVRARAYALAAGGLENPRLLLASTRRSPTGVGNERDVVGRYYMDHPRGEGLASVDLRGLSPSQRARLVLLGEKAKSEYGRIQLRLTFPEQMQREERLLNHGLHAHLVSDFHGSEAYEAARRLVERVRGREFAPSKTLRDLRQVAAGGPGLARHAVHKLLDRVVPTRLIVIDQMEQEPDPQSRVSVDFRRRDRFGLPKVQLDWRIGASTYRSQRRMHQLFGDILRRAGIDGFRSEVLENPDAPLPLWDMKHPTGTTRMSDSPDTGVVDPAGRVHGVDNLYVTGSSVFPAAGHANPTLLIVALAARLADHLRHRYAH